LYEYNKWWNDEWTRSNINVSITMNLNLMDACTWNHLHFHTYTNANTYKILFIHTHILKTIYLKNLPKSWYKNYLLDKTPQKLISTSPIAFLYLHILQNFNNTLTNFDKNNTYIILQCYAITTCCNELIHCHNKN
jgi:hypothetical protein